MKYFLKILFAVFILIFLFCCSNNKKKKSDFYKDKYNTYNHVYNKLENKYLCELANLESLNKLKLNSLKRREITLAIYFLIYSDSVKQKCKDIFKTGNSTNYIFVEQYKLLINYKKVIKNVIDTTILFYNQNSYTLKYTYEKDLEKRFADVFNSYRYNSNELTYYGLHNKLLLDIQLILDDYYSFYFWHLYTPQYFLLEDSSHPQSKTYSVQKSIETK